MYTPDLIIGTKTYALTSQRALSSIRSDASQPVTAPKTITISHENAKNLRRSSAVILDDTIIVSTAGAVVPVKDNIKVLLKVQFNPFGGRTTTTADINAAIAQLVAFLGVPANITKLLNQES